MGGYDPALDQAHDHPAPSPAAPSPVTASPVVAVSPTDLLHRALGNATLPGFYLGAGGAPAGAGSPTAPATPAPQGIEPHYPTDDERQEIDRLLGRERHTVTPAPQAPKPAPAPTPAAPVPAAPAAPAPVVVQGRVLAPAEVTALAARLGGQVLASMRTSNAAGSSGTARTPPPLTEDEAYAAVDRAWQDIRAKYGRYLYRQLTLTRDRSRLPAARKPGNEVLVTFRSTETLGYTAGVTAATEHPVVKAALADVAEDSRQEVYDKIARSLLRTDAEALRTYARINFGANYQRESDLINVPLDKGDRTYGLVVHEVMHALAHPRWVAAFRDEKLVNEGFTDYLAREVTDTHSAPEYQGYVAAVGGVRSALTGPFPLTRLNGPEAEESLRLAFFQGRLDLIGWTPNSPTEEALVAAAGPAPIPRWDPVKGDQAAKAYKEQYAKAQAPSRNVLGVGLLFQQSGGSPSFDVRYARVLARSENARAQLTLDGQVFGAPIGDLRSFGARVGLGLEYQEPWFFARIGARLSGAAVSGGTDRVDVSPFVGAGIRAWQTVRVGAEGFLLLPILGGGTVWGGGATVGVEF